jgi:pimeloyl-ACP methyl ester carboxylesterase
MEWLAAIAVVVLGVPAAAFFAQERLIFFPQPIASTSHLPTRAEPLEIVAADGARLRGWIVKAEAATAPALIYFGGNAEEVSSTAADARWPQNWTVVAINYRGYGESEGKPGERELRADALAIYDAVAQRPDIDPGRVVLVGRSLGTAIAVHVAAERRSAGVILVSPYDSLVEVGRQHYPWLPVSLLLRHRFDALTRAERTRTPLMTLVAESDPIISLARSRALYDGWAGPKTWHVIPGTGHNTVASSEAYWKRIAAFLDQR